MFWVVFRVRIELLRTELVLGLAFRVRLLRFVTVRV